MRTYSVGVIKLYNNIIRTCLHNNKSPCVYKVGLGWAYEL